MCGIAGIIGWKGTHTEAEDGVRRMMAEMGRRGPDSAGLESWPGAVLGHRRLAVFDPSEAGHQPMVSPGRDVGVVFNGAIYNFRQLRCELEDRGYGFESDTDTEVLVHGYREWGIDHLVRRLHGMFAFGLWDRETRTVFLARDRLGQKPLAYHARGGALAFASTPRALRAAGSAGRLDEKAIAEFLEFGFVTDTRSIYRGVRKVPAGTVVEWSEGSVRRRRYWSLPSPGDNGTSFEEVVAETEDLLLSAVEARLQADVPVGVLLSGGIDSGLVCWAIDELGSDITAFTVGTPGHPWDETADARDTARALGLDHVVIEMSGDDSPDIVQDLVAAYGEPFACASALGMLKVSRAVGSSATVLLTGDGGDDVFLGYERHRYLRLAQDLARRLPAPLAECWPRVRGLIPEGEPMAKLKRFLNCATGGVGAYIDAQSGLPLYRRSGWLGERLSPLSVPQRGRHRSLHAARRALEEYIEYHQRTRFVGEYMTKVDGATMHYGLEARSPFLDQRIWEYAAQLPFQQRLRRYRPKAILREIARRRIDRQVAGKPKRGFGIPVQRWVAGRWRSAVEDAFRDSILERKGFIRTRPILSELETSAERGVAPEQVWYVYVLEMWLRSEDRGTR